MRLKFQLLVLASLLMATGNAMAADSSVARDMYTQNGFDGRILDAATPMATRAKLFSHVIELANAGQVPAQDLAGTLYWQGPATEGSPVPVDIKQARALLGNAAVHGDLLAMAKMAELELQAGNPTAAMVWAQLYGHYLNPVTSRAHQGSRRTAYAGDLLQRVMAAGGKIDDKTSKDVNAVVNRYDQQIKDGMEAMRWVDEHGEPRVISMPRSRLTGEATNLNGVAQYMIAFNPAGEAVHVWTLASYPDSRISAVTRADMDRVHANPTNATTELRYLLVSIPLNGRHSSLRIAH